MSRQLVSDPQIVCLLPSKSLTLGLLTMKQKKKQDDRLLKQLTRIERKQQEALRMMIQNDLSFANA